MGSSELVYADRSFRGKLRVAGAQRAWFLHQVLTQAFEDIQPGEARPAAMITAHGRLLAYMEVVATQDSLLCHFEPELRATLPETLGRYIFATQVEITDVTEELALVFAGGDGWEAALGDVPAEVVVHASSSTGIPGAYLWVDPSQQEVLMSELADKGFRRADEDELESARILAGVARWGHEMDEKTFPQEAGIDDQAVHYDKGCYLGQEAMAKIHFRGKVNRRLARLDATAPLTEGGDVLLGEAKIGRVTSAAGTHGLALVRHDVEPGAEVTAGGTPAKIAS